MWEKDLSLDPAFEIVHFETYLEKLHNLNFDIRLKALEAVNKVVSKYCYLIGSNQKTGEDYSSIYYVAVWLDGQNTLKALLSNFLHRSVYVEKLEDISRLLLHFERNSIENIQIIWSAQMKKDDVIVKNIYMLMNKLALDYSTCQVEWLTENLINSWPSSDLQYQDKILELFLNISRNDLYEETIHKILTLLWDLAHRIDLTSNKLNDIFESFIKIVQFHYDDTESSKHEWLDKCVSELKTNASWEVPAMILMKKLCQAYKPFRSEMKENEKYFCCESVIDRLQNEHAIISKVTGNLVKYMERIRNCMLHDPSCIDNNKLTDKYYTHNQQIEERLGFLSFMLKDGQQVLCLKEAMEVWKYLVESPLTSLDYQLCLEWFEKMASEELHKEAINEIFTKQILQFPVETLNKSSYKCFETFFIAQNCAQKKLELKEDGLHTLQSNLTGLDVVWDIILSATDEIAEKAIELLKNISVNINISLIASQLKHHEMYIKKCCNLLKDNYDACCSSEVTDNKKIDRMCRVLKILFYYINGYEKYFIRDRKFLPLYRAFRGRDMILLIQFTQSDHNLKNFDYFTHENDIFISVRKVISEKINHCCEMELICEDKILSHNEDYKQLVKIPLSNKTVIKVNIFSHDIKIRKRTPTIDSELVLPSVLLSLNSTYHSILCQLHELGRQKYPRLCENTKQVLDFVACDATVVRTIHAMFYDEDLHEVDFKNMFFDGTPAEILYNLKVLYAILMPANGYLEEEVCAFRIAFMTNKKTHKFFDVFSEGYITDCDKATKCSIYLEITKICKLILIIICATLAKSSIDDDMPVDSNELSSPGGFIQQALKAMYGTDHDVALIEVAQQDSGRLSELLEENESIIETVTIFQRAVTWRLPSYSVVLQITRLVWASSCGNFESFCETEKIIHSICLSSTYTAIDSDEILLYKKSVELLSISVVSNPNSLELLCSRKILPLFFNDLLLLNPNQMLRMATAEQFLIVFICSDPFRKIVQKARDSLLTLIRDPTLEKYSSSVYEVFYFLCQLIHSDRPLRHADTILNQEIKWLQTINYAHPVLLEGRLRFISELIDCIDLKKKESMGAVEGGNLIKIILEKYLFPATISKRFSKIATRIVNVALVLPICNTPESRIAAFNLLKTLCDACTSNYYLLFATLDELFFSDDSLCLTKWECLPVTDDQAQQSFVGLKNGGATCYINSILQQLFMEKDISEGLISFQIPHYRDVNLKPDKNEKVSIESTFRERYNIIVLKTTQEIFIQLKFSRMQYYEPSFLWKHFLIDGRHIRLTDHHDAVNFYMLLIDSLNEALLKLNGPPIFQNTLGGTFSDQKICMECPHKYMKEEKFNIVSVEVKDQKNLLQSLKQYVRAEPLKGDDAYYCEQCQKKVLTLKRLCFKTLPKTLVIQLKRFEYNYRRRRTVKHHGYFEFPRSLDMLPYTVLGLSKQGKNVISCNTDGDNYCTTYKLSGIVIHNGEASAGHYFSYIRNGNIWYKFDDKYVERIDLHIDKCLEEFCFGCQSNENYTEKVYSAYMLFYTREDYENPEVIGPRKNIFLTSKDDVKKETISFLHSSSQLEVEYIEFIRKLLQDNMPLSSDLSEVKTQETSMISIQLGSKYLFQTGWRTTTNLRGPAILWTDILCFYLKSSKDIRSWFATQILFKTPKTISEYLLQCPVEDVRQAFRKLLVEVTSLLHGDGSCLPPPGYIISNHYSTMGDHIICSLLKLLVTELSQYPYYIIPYCQFFLSYAEKGRGSYEVKHLLTLNIPTAFIMVATNEGPNPDIKYKSQTLTILHQVVFKLVRSSECLLVRQTRNNVELKPNMYYCDGGPVLPLNNRTRELLFGRLKYLQCCLKEYQSTNELLLFLQYCSWENAKFSRSALFLVTKSLVECQEEMLEHYKSLLLGLLLIQDSWQSYRLKIFFNGLEDFSGGIFALIIAIKVRNSQRAYYCIQLLIDLFCKCKLAVMFLFDNVHLLTTWQRHINWLEKRVKVDLKVKPQEAAEQRNNIEKMLDKARNLRDILTDNKSEMSSPDNLLKN